MPRSEWVLAGLMLCAIIAAGRPNDARVAADEQKHGGEGVAVVEGDGNTIMAIDPKGPKVTLSVNPTGVVLPGQDNNMSGQNKINVQRFTITLANNEASGTVLNQLACNAPDGTAINCPTAAVAADIIGVVVAGAGKKGVATIAPFGTGITCAFDGATKAGNYVTLSQTSAGKCHATATPPSIRVGWIQTSNGGANAYPITLVIR